MLSRSPAAGRVCCQLGPSVSLSKMRFPIRHALLTALPVLTLLSAAADEPANQKLQAELSAGGGELVIPAGTHLFTAPLEVNLAETGAVSIRAKGPVTIKMAGPGPAIRLTGTHTGTAAPQSFHDTTWKQRMPVIEGFEIIGSHPEADGIELRGTMQATIKNVAVRRARHGIRLVQRNRNVIISDCHLYENSGIGIFLDHVNLHQINIANSHVSYNRNGGIVVRNGEVRNLHVTGCDIEANMPGDRTPTTTANILLDQSTDLEGKNSIAEIAITGCTIQHSAHYGKDPVAPGGANIRILGNARHQPNMITITGNILSDTTTHLHLREVMDVTVTGNTFFTSENTDLLVEDSKRVTVSGNAFNPREPNTRGGIILRDSSHCLLLGLTIHQFQNPEGALLLERCRTSRIAQCIISDSRSGIALRDCTSCVVNDCTITGLPEGARPVRASGKGNLTDRIHAPTGE